MKKKTAGDAANIQTFFCQVDTYLGVKDYLRGGRCVRLVGVRKTDFNLLVQREIGDGVTAYVLDVDLEEFVRFRRPVYWSHWRDRLVEWLKEEDREPLQFRPWFRIDVIPDLAGVSYSYEAFSRLAIDRFRVFGLEEHQKVPDLRSLLPGRKRPESGSVMNAGRLGTASLGLAQLNPMLLPAHLPASQKTYRFSALHVGQGMCSLAYDDQNAVVFDAGAGTPVTRPRYLHEKGFRNDLEDIVRSRAVPYLVLSHYDYDHWKLLAWDEGLRAKVQVVIAPDVAGVSIAFFDKQLKGKVQREPSFTVILGSSGSSISHRSSPKHHDSNGNCLVTVVKLGKRTALVPGDYVYNRMLDDKKAWIVNSARSQFDAVIVPHHGDTASASDVPVPATQLAKAFFSAGNHKGYGHPKGESVSAHRNKGFQTVVKPLERYVVEHKLIV